MSRGVSASDLAQTVVEYFDGCNEADAEKMLGCMRPNACHYFPAGAPQGPFVSAQEIADGWCRAVATLGSRWTIDSLVADEGRRTVAIEWTHWKTNAGNHLRGSEHYSFDEEGLIDEIRAYYAAPQADPESDAVLGDYDYQRAGFATSPPQ